MKKHLFNRLIVACLVLILTSSTAFAGTGSERKEYLDVAGKLQKALKAQGQQGEAQEARPKKVWEKAQENLDAQAEKVAAAQKAYDDIMATKNKGSLGFFEYEGSTQAANVIKYRLEDQVNDNEWGKTNVGAEGDATSLENFRAALDFIKKGNDLRASDPNNSGVNKDPLKISDREMAIAQIQANASAEKVGHSEIYGGGENLAWGYTDPYKAWYTKEKPLYEAGNTNGAGHYLNLINPTNSYNRRYIVTGFGVNTNGSLYSTTHSQTFSTVSNDTLYTVDEYKARLDNYCNAIEQELTAAQAALAAAKAYQAELIANGGISNAEKKAIENTRTTDTEDFISLQRPGSGEAYYRGDTIKAEYDVYDTWKYYYTSASIAVMDSKGRLIKAIPGAIADVGRRTGQKGNVYLDPAKYPPGTYDIWIFNVPCYSNGASVEGWETWDNVPYARVSFTVKCKHQWNKDYTVDKAATCTEEGSKSIHCSLCNATRDKQAIPAGHDWGAPAWTWTADHKGASAKFICRKDKTHVKTIDAKVTRSVDGSGDTVYTAKVSFEGKEYTNTEAEAKSDRIYGADRYDTAKGVADKYKGNGDKFKNVVVAYGKNFPDALAGGYLAKVKDAPILLVDPTVEDGMASYIGDNIASGGTVYILGGTGVVSLSFENKVKAEGIKTERLGGADRYETNLKILKAAGVRDQDILVCTGAGYADSLSASAAGLPILLVGNTLSSAQKTYISSIGTKKFYLIGASCNI